MFICRLLTAPTYSASPHAVHQPYLWPLSPVLSCFIFAGGLAVWEASALLLDCTIASCYAAGWHVWAGGGIATWKANLTLIGSRIWRCHGPWRSIVSGGGVMARKSNVELLDGSIITECTAIQGSGMRAGLGRTCRHRSLRHRPLLSPTAKDTVAEDSVAKES